MDHCGTEAQVQIKKLQYGKDYRQREYIFFTVVFNRYRDVSRDTRHQVRDRFEKAECECVLALPDSYRGEGAKTPLVMTFHGAGHIVNAQRDEIGGVKFAGALLDAGYAALVEGVLIVDDASVSGGGYTFTPPRPLREGDVLMLQIGGENHPVKVASVAQHADGSVTVPEVLRKYLGGLEVIK